MNDLLHRLGTTYAVTGTLVHAVAPDGWSTGTPCPDWDVAALVRHVVVGNRYFAGIVTGDDPGLADLDADVAGLAVEALPAAYDAAAATVVAALSRPGALEQTYATRLGEVSGEVVAHVRIVEALAHGWDLSVATRRPLEVDEALVEDEIAAARHLASLLPPGFTPYGTQQPVSAGASPLDRLAALLGRRTP